MWGTTAVQPDRTAHRKRVDRGSLDPAGKDHPVRASQPADRDPIADGVTLEARHTGRNESALAGDLHLTACRTHGVDAAGDFDPYGNAACLRRRRRPGRENADNLPHPNLRWVGDRSVDVNGGGCIISDLDPVNADRAEAGDDTDNSGAADPAIGRHERCLDLGRNTRAADAAIRIMLDQTPEARGSRRSAIGADLANAAPSRARVRRRTGVQTSERRADEQQNAGPTHNGPAHNGRAHNGPAHNGPAQDAGQCHVSLPRPLSRS